VSRSHVGADEITPTGKFNVYNRVPTGIDARHIGIRVLHRWRPRARQKYVWRSDAQAANLCGFGAAREIAG